MSFSRQLLATAAKRRLKLSRTCWRLASRCSVDLGAFSTEPNAPPFDELGFDEGEGFDFPIDDAVDGDHDVVLERRGLLETVVGVEEDRVLFEWRGVRAEEGDRDHEGRILHEDAGVAVVRVIVVRAMADNDIGFPFADQPSENLAIFEGGHEFAVVDVEHFGGHSQNGCRRLDFGVSSFGQRTSRHSPVTDVAVCGRDELHQVAALGPEDRNAATANLAIVRVGPKDKDTQAFRFLAVDGTVLESAECCQYEDESNHRAEILHLCSLPKLSRFLHGQKSMPGSKGSDADCPHKKIVAST